jgi:hypothetical protein
MGGFGSGRPSGSGRANVEDCRSIDVNRLHREGCLRPGWAGLWQWTRDGERVAWINLCARVDRLHLTYRVRFGGGDWQDVKESVRIVRVACRYGGARPYFMCPGMVNGAACGRRAAKLYMPGRYFVCRHCNRLSYASQSEGVLDRDLRRANKIRERLGGEPGMISQFPVRPKGMWLRTYQRLQRKTFESEMHAEEAIYAGRVGTGMPVKVLADLRRRLDPLARKTLPLSVPPPRGTRFGSPLVLSRVHWVEPKLVAEITYLTWTADNLLRHTVYVGLREDKPAADVRREAARVR